MIYFKINVLIFKSAFNGIALQSLIHVEGIYMVRISSEVNLGAIHL